MKASAIAPSNLAFIKYWGRHNTEDRLPVNSSISMNLSSLTTNTTVEFSSQYEADEITIDGRTLSATEYSRTTKQLQRVRDLLHVTERAKVVSTNNFPSGTGLSSSASGFAALTAAAVAAAGAELTEKELSILARKGSGSACRSIPNGFVEWLSGTNSEDSYAYSLYPADYWNIHDVVAVVSKDKKEIPTAEGQELAQTSPFFMSRTEQLPQKILRFKEALKNKDFTQFGEMSEQDALEMHAIMITSSPSLIYWSEGSLSLMKQVLKWRQQGLEVYFSLNTGQDLHLLCQEQDLEKLTKKLKELEYVSQVIVNEPAPGTKLTTTHLF